LDRTVRRQRHDGRGWRPTAITVVSAVTGVALATVDEHATVSFAPR
jgi:hypothetical protein